jgi:hypothetical protein
MSKKVYLALIMLVALVVVASVTAFYIFNSNKRESSIIAVGVNVGDVFTYQMVGFANSHVEFSVPENFVDVNNTKYYRVEITKVEAPIVSYTVTWEFNNGTEHSYDGMINLENGLYSGYYWEIYAANLNAGSLCRPESKDEPKINSTQTKSLSDGNDRDINFLYSNYEAYDPTDETYTKMCYVYHYVYFDKQMGMMMAYRTMQIYNSPEIILTVEYNLVEYKQAGTNTVKIPDNLSFFS